MSWNIHGSQYSNSRTLRVFSLILKMSWWFKLNQDNERAKADIQNLLCHETSLKKFFWRTKTLEGDVSHPILLLPLLGTPLFHGRQVKCYSRVLSLPFFVFFSLPLTPIKLVSELHTFTPHLSPLHSKYCHTFRPPSLPDYTVKENTNWYHYLFFHISISPISSVVNSPKVLIQTWHLLFLKLSITACI